MNRNIFITGANRGLGLAFVKHYLQNGDHVYASCRDPKSAHALLTLKNDHAKQLELIPLDVAKTKDIESVKALFLDKSLDILINNAGLFGPSGVSIDNVEENAWKEVLAVNAIAPILLTQALLASIKKGATKKLAYVTSRMGSIADNDSGGRYIYRSSKAALNAAVHSMALDLKEDKICCLLLHPGWVQTDMGGGDAELSAAESSQRLIQIIEKATIAETGCFISHTGDQLPW